MKVLIAGFSPQSATAVELVIGSFFPDTTLVRLARNGLSGLPEQPATAQQCDACVLDLLGLGLVQHSPPRDAEVLAFLAGRGAILFAPTGSADAWRDAFPTNGAGSPPRLVLEHPATAVSLREALSVLEAATIRPAPSPPAQAARAPVPEPSPPAAPRAPSHERIAAPLAAPVARPATGIAAGTPRPAPAVNARQPATGNAIASATAVPATPPARPREAPPGNEGRRQPAPAVAAPLPPAAARPTATARPRPLPQQPPLPEQPALAAAPPNVAASAARRNESVLPDHPPSPTATNAQRPATAPEAIAATPTAGQELRAAAPIHQVLPQPDPAQAESAVQRSVLIEPVVHEESGSTYGLAAETNAFGEMPLDMPTLPPHDLLPINRTAEFGPPAQAYSLDENAYLALVAACPEVGRNPYLDLVCRIVMRPAPSELRITTRTGAVFFPRENWVASNISTAVRKRLTQHEMMLHVVQVHALADHQAHDHAARLFGRRGAGPRALDAFMWSLVFTAFEHQAPTSVGDLRFLVHRFPQFAGLERMPELFLHLSKASIRKPQSLSGLKRAFANYDPNLVTLFVACTVLAGVATVLPGSTRSSSVESTRRSTPTTSEKARNDGLLRSLLDKLF